MRRARLNFGNHIRKIVTYNAGSAPLLLDKAIMLSDKNLDYTSNPKHDHTNKILYYS